MDKTVRSAALRLALNVLFAAYHIVFALTESSVWLFAVGVYYVILSTMRFVLIRTERGDRFAMRFTGAMLIAMSATLAAIVVLAFIRERGTVYHEIVMIGIAVYAFTKITRAAVHWAGLRRSRSAKAITLRSVSFASAFVSILSLQRSMLVTYPGMSPLTIRWMNAATGAFVCVIVFWLGLHLLRLEKRRSTQ